MADQERAIALAMTAFGQAHGCAANAVEMVAVDRELIPNPPLKPGQMSIDPVRYRFFVTLRSGAVSERLRVEGKNVYRA